MWGGFTVFLAGFGRPRRQRHAFQARRPRTRLAAAAFSVAALAGTTAVAVPTAAPAAAQTGVSLTFDNGAVSQYTLGYQQALQPRGVPATFYINSGTVGRSTTMSWSQLSTLAAAGDEIGGKTVDGTNLTTLSSSQQIAEICNDRQAILQHGLKANSFAYPGGAFNTTIESEVQNCGYGNARTAGSLSPTGSTYAETLPPKTWLALRAYAPGGQVTLSNLESLVSGAASHGGGWVPIVIQKVCSQSLDPSNYSTCTASSGWIDLGDLNTFLSWVQNAGNSGGAPAGAVFNTMGATAISADTVAPATTISCNGSPCASTTYTGTVTVALAPTDLGSGVASTHYTTDGTTPTLSSPTYTSAFPLTSSATVQYRSWDNAGNAEAAHSQAINVQQASDTTPPTTTISCNGAACASTPYTAPVTVTLTATDNPGGWGVASTYYTTDGSTPTTSSTVYTGPFTVQQNTTVKFFSTDLAGNAEQPNTQVIQFKTMVSLTFDDGDESQYSLGFLRGLQPHGMNGTFYIVSGYVGVNSGAMTWPQISDLANNSNDVGGHTVDHIDLTSSSYTQQQKTAEVCDNFQALAQHGVDPVSFAYPYGAYDSNAEQIVQSCGFSSARITGGLDRNGTGAGPVYGESIPPKDPYAVRTVYNSGGSAPYTLSYLENSVTAAAQNGGGWVPLVFHEICSQTYDPANYNYCSTSWASTELATFNTFLDWLQNAGQPGGAPAGVAVQTVRQVVNGPDTTPPTTTMTCDGSSCQAAAYNGSTTVALSAVDKGGSGVKATYYTTDGSTPTTSSPVWNNQPFTINSNATFKFFSVDNAGNVEPVETQTVQVQPNTDPVIGAAGDIACDPAAPAFNNGQGTATDCKAMSTAGLLTSVDAVLPLGDDQYNCGGLSAFEQSYGPAWGVKRAITYPVPGDKDYATSGGTDCPATPGAGYQTYFGGSGGNFGSPLPSVVNVNDSTAYYSYNLGSWHIIALNTSPCALGTPSFCAAGSAQEQWLQNDLAHDTAGCTVAYYQNPRFTSTPGGGDATYQQLWQDLYNGGVDVVLNGDSHWYERFAPMNASGAVDNTNGVREFIVGTGGAPLDTPSTELPSSQVLNNTTHGIIKLTLHNGSYAWQFVNDGESSFTDSGSTPCHGAPDLTPPTTTMTCNSGSCSGWFNSPVSVSLAATDNQGGSGVAATYYTTDGSAPTTSSSKYTGPFTVSGTSTVKFFSVDNAGNTEPVQSQQVQIDTSPPSTAIACNGAPCSGGFYNAAVKVTLLPTDNSGGAGVNATFYTTDGSNPATSPTATLYTGAFTVPATTTVQYYSTDLAGNSEAVNSQQIQVDNSTPVTTIACNAAACSGGWYNTAVQVTLSATDTGGPGVANTYYTTDGSTPTTSSTVYTGAFTVSSTSTVKFFSTDTAGSAEPVNSQQIQVDTTAPTTTISCNGGACGTGWYNAAVKVTLSAADNTGGSGVAGTFYTTDGTDPATSPTATLYTGAFTVSQSATVKYYSTDSSGNSEATKSQAIQLDTTAPATTIACNGGACASGWYNAAVQVTLSATDTGGPGVANTYYTTDGSTPTTSSTVYTGAFAVAATATVKFFSVDAAGNAEPVNSQRIQVDTTAPTTTISCNGGTCGTGWYNAAVTVTLSATDTGGSGVNATTYTTDGTNPATSPTATLYTGPFTVSQSATVKYYSTDMAGNSEAVKSQALQIDTTPPTTAALCNAAACSGGWYSAAVKVTLTATDTGSGVSKTYYTTNGSTPTTSSTVYTGQLTIQNTTTVKFFSVDTVGNSEPVKSQLIQIDTVAPTTTITCNSAACSTGWYKATPVTVGLSAADNSGGSGVSGTYYTTNGSTPTTSSTRYTGPFTVSQTATVKYFSIDTAGNSEPVKSQSIQIDAAAPTVSITAPASGSSFAQGTKVTVTASATDLGTGSGAPSGIASVTFYLDGTTVLATDTSSPYSFSWNTNKVAKGTHKLTAVATDTAGNSATSAAITITIG
jgi:peptidoglycan/xylan/chitin deacetylase (PgdA/CDA1 family)